MKSHRSCFPISRSSIALAFLSLSLTVFFASCEQSNPEDVLGRQGDIVHFAGKKWDIKSAATPVGPGPNNFSKLYDDVWVDEHGYLHLSISKHNGVWYSTEVISQDTVGYGTYEFTIQANPMDFASNVVLGLFTWDNNTFYTDANSEVDIEFSKWGDAESTTPLTMSVQPVNFGPYYPERSRKADINPALLNGVTTHVFTWTDTLITWYSYVGDMDSGNAPFASWDFDLDHPGRVKNEGGNSSQPVVIPAPGNTTHARMNFWTLPHVAYGPANELNHEVVIRDFRYTPLN
jgi:hypothetical protein